MPDRALITMDDLEVAVPTNAAFEAAGYETTLVSSQDNHPAILKKSNPDIVILTGGLHEHPTTVLVSYAREHATSTLAVLEETEPNPMDLARALGVTAFAVKPVEPDDVVALAGRLIARRRLQERTGIIGESAAVQQVLVQIEQMAPVSSTVLIEGESGTGKELVAQAIHDLSPRRGKPFIAINCAALPDSLLESELFGHEKGAFTGAAERRLGRFELADTGTLFLDEIGEMRLALQVKMLRVLESRSFFRVGGASAIHVDVRVIAATNRGIKEAVTLGEFRDDLYYRLNVLRIYLPPLRERKIDIPILVERFVAELAEQHGRTFRGITPEAVDILVNAHWPGNVRELRNLIESMVVLAPGRQIEAADIPADVREGGTRLLPARVSAEAKGAGRGQELRFIFQSLVELKMQIEDLQRRMAARRAPASGSPAWPATPWSRSTSSPAGREAPRGPQRPTRPLREGRMTQRVVLIRHGDDPADDRVATFAGTRGSSSIFAAPTRATSSAIRMKRSRPAPSMAGPSTSSRPTGTPS